jgi:hypothetical protein
VTGQRRALIIANDLYENDGLRHLLSPAADAEALGRVLGDAEVGGFDVRVVHNEPSHVMGAHVEDLFSEAKPDDVLLVHFSGHGLKSESGELYFAARNTRPNRLGSTALSADFVQRCMRASRSRSIVLLLDCCYGGAFGQGVAVRAAGDVNVLDSFPGGRGGGRGRAVISASSSMEYAFEGDRLADEQGRSPSVFTTALVEGLSTGDADRDEDGWVSLNELYEYVFDRVRERNPNQTPSRDVEMQGELYLARSRRRRVRPQPVPADLRAAMTDANMFSRLGAVTELRRRLVSDNLPVAMGAFEALREIAGSDIQYVAEAATAALREAAIRPAEAELRFGTVTAGTEPDARVLRLLGPPLARACTYQASESWIVVTETAAGPSVSVRARHAGAHRGTLTVKGPTGEVTVPVEVDVRAAPPAVAVVPAPPAARPEPVSRPAPVAPPPAPPTAAAPPVTAGSRHEPPAWSPPGAAGQPQVPQAEPPEAAGAPPGAAGSRQMPLAAPVEPPRILPAASTPLPVPLLPLPSQPQATERAPWWAAAVLAAGAIVLIVLNWPGSTETRLAWHDSETGWEVYRTPDDPFILASVLALVAALAAPLVARGAKIALGVLAGGAGYLALASATLLIGEIGGDESGYWIGSLAVSAGLAALALFVARPRGPFGWPAWPGTALVVAGGVLLVASPSVTSDGVAFLGITYGADAVEPLVLAAVALLALAAGERPTRRFLGAAAATAALLGAVDLIPAWKADMNAGFWLGIAGNGLVFGALAVGLPRAPRGDRTAAPAMPWGGVIGLVGAGLLLLFVNGQAISEWQRLWVDTYQGSPELMRQSYDGTVYAALLIVVAALLTRAGGAVSSYALGGVAGAAVLFATTGLVVLSGGFGHGASATVWTASLATAVAVLLGVAVAWTRQRQGAGLGRPATVPATLLGASFVALLVPQFVAVDDGISAGGYIGPLVLLLPVVPAALGALAVTSRDPDTRRIAVGAVGAYGTLFAIASCYPIFVDSARLYWLAMLSAHLLLVAAAAAVVAVHRPLSVDQRR